MAEEKSLTEIKSLARGYTLVSIQTLGGIAKDGLSEPARVAAAIALLDRGWGKPESTTTAKVTGADGEGPVRHEVLIRDIAAEKAKAG